MNYVKVADTGNKNCCTPHRAKAMLEEEPEEPENKNKNKRGKEEEKKK
jgi:hypothetical protein